MRPEIKEFVSNVKGFLSETEGMKLFQLAAENSIDAPCIEIGSYCGKSSIFLAEGCRFAGKNPLFCIDHHRGSEEQQYGQQYFDPELYDPEQKIIDTFPFFMKNIRKAGLLEWVVPVVTTSALLSRYVPDNSFSLVFIDGGHSEQDVFADFNGWGPKIKKNGYLCIHDIFPNPADGGQAPYNMLQHAVNTKQWDFTEQIETLGILKRR
jgi:MMP 1-O-methyltransferase